MKICSIVDLTGRNSSCCIAVQQLNKMMKSMGHRVISNVNENLPKDVSSAHHSKKDTITEGSTSGYVVDSTAQLLIYHTDSLQIPKDKSILAFHGRKVLYLHAGDATKPAKETEQATLPQIFDVAATDCIEAQNALKKSGFVNSEMVRYPVMEKVPERVVRSCGKSIICFASGAFVPEDNLEDVIAVFNTYYQTMNRRAKLYIFAQEGSDLEYIKEIEDFALVSGCTNAIKITTGCTNEKIEEAINEASVWITMSTRERINAGMIKAMCCGIPVIAMKSKTAETVLGRSGLLVTKSDVTMIARCLNEILQDQTLNMSIVDAQFTEAEKYSKDSCEAALKELLNEWIGHRKGGGEDKSEKYYPKIQIRGTFASSYSLDIVNRRLAEALYQEGLADTSIHCTQYSGDYVHSQQELESVPVASFLWRREGQQGVPDIALRNTWPPVVTELTAQYNFENFGWEEDKVPKEIVDSFNRSLDGVGTMSEFVTQTLIHSGLTIPVKTMHIGVQLPDDYKDYLPYPLNSKKKTKFLHISSAFPRKGIDILLKAYFSAFCEKDNVCLVLKTFPNVHNQTGKMLKEFRKKYPKGPEVEWIDCDLPESDLYGLYKAVDCYVHSARGEGFGLPIAEAMLAKIPTIVCNNTGLADFCTDDTCITVGYSMTTAQTHLSEKGSHWAEPHTEELKTRLWDFVYEPEKLDIAGKVKRAYELISTEYTWAYVAKQWVAWTKEIIGEASKPGVDIVTTWNTKCGVAEYTRYFWQNANLHMNPTIYPNESGELLRPDEEFVAERCWVSGGDDVDRLIVALQKSKNKVVDIQYNLGFYPIETLAKIIDNIYLHKAIILTFHATNEISNWIKSGRWRKVVKSLNNVYKIIVHQDSDIEVLKKAGVMSSKLNLLPLGQIAYTGHPIVSAQKIIGITSQHVIGSYGFLLPHKGIRETIRAVALLRERYPDILFIASCAQYTSEPSERCYKDCVALIERFGLQDNVLMIEDFLDPAESMLLLQACHVLIMPYGPTGESASGAVRFCIAAKRPLITTKEHIFNEIVECTYQIPDNEPETIADAVTYVFENTSAQEKCLKAIEEQIEKTNWHTISMKKIELYREAERWCGRG